MYYIRMCRKGAAPRRSFLPHGPAVPVWRPAVLHGQGDGYYYSHAAFLQSHHGLPPVQDLPAGKAFPHVIFLFLS